MEMIMTSRLRRTFVVAALGLFAASLTAAQTARPPGEQARPQRRPGGPGGPGGRPDEMRKSLSLFFVHRARVALDLSDDQALKLLPLVEKVEQLRQKSGERRAAIAQQLEEMAGHAVARDDEVVALVRALDQEEDRMRADHLKARDEMMALLTPQQKARFVLFANRLRGAVEDQVRALRRDRRPGDGPEGDRGGPEGPDELDPEPPREP
jgi:Spy/CpxP family protein refolding chaperone